MMKNSSAAKLSLAAVAALTSVSGFVHDLQAAVVINEVYGGGGSTSTNNATIAAYPQDFVELYNNGTAAVDLTGLAVRYASAGATAFTFTGTTNVGVLSGSLNPGAYYVVSGSSSAGYVGVGTLSANATSSISAASSAGKIGLFAADGTTALDIVAYGGTASVGGEGASSTVSPGLTGSVGRIVDGLDTNINAVDFTLDTPTPGAANVAAPEPTALGLAAVASALVLRRRNKQ